MSTMTPRFRETLSINPETLRAVHDEWKALRAGINPEYPVRLRFGPVYNNVPGTWSCTYGWAHEEALSRLLAESDPRVKVAQTLATVIRKTSKLLTNWDKETVESAWLDLTLNLYPDKAILWLYLPEEQEESWSKRCDGQEEWQLIRAWALRNGVLRIVMEVFGGWDEGETRIEKVVPDQIRKTQPKLVQKLAGMLERYFWENVRGTSGPPTYSGTWDNNFAEDKARCELTLREEVSVPVQIIALLETGASSK